MSKANTMFKVSGLKKSFGGLVAVNDVSFSISKGEMLGIMGPNGSGKTTLFNLITGFLDPDSGFVEFKDEDITGLRPDQIAKKGIARSFQTVRPFSDLSVRDNLKVGWIEVGRDKESGIDEFNVLEEIIELEEVSDTPAKNLPHGLQRRLEVGRAVSINPDLLLLDEPLAGATQKEAEELVDTIKELSLGRAIAIVEHEIQHLMDICNERILVLNEGKILMEGAPEEVRENTEVKKAYFGE